jgi:hypothetical protein
MVIRVPEDEVRAVGPAAVGVMGMRLEKKEILVAVDVVRRDQDLLVVGENGFGKRVPLPQFAVQGRNGRGLRVFKTGVSLAGASVGTEDDHAFLHLARGGARSVKFSAVPRRSRAANGARLVDTGAKDRVVLVGSASARPSTPPPAPPGPTTKGKRKTAAKKGKSGPASPSRSRGKKGSPAKKPRARKPVETKRPTAKKPGKKKGKS